MDDLLTREKSAYLATLGALLTRMRAALNSEEAHAPSLLECARDLESVQHQYIMTVTRASMSSKQHGDVGKATTAFHLVMQSGNLEEKLLEIIRRLAAILASAADETPAPGSRINSGSASKKKALRSMSAPLGLEASSRAHTIRELTRSMTDLERKVEACLRGESKGLREALTGPRDIETCEDCGTELATNSERSEHYCPRCARVFPIFGVVFEEQQLLSQEGQRTKSGCFMPGVHYQDWVNNILALKPDSELLSTKFPSETAASVVEKLKNTAREKNKLPSQINVETMRMLLKAIGRSDLNPHVALLMKLVTGNGPPEIPKVMRMRAQSMFLKMLDARARISDNTPNRRYYPYYTIKIFDLILPPGDPGRAMFKFVHMQSQDTLTKNDKEWREICGFLGWEFRPTILSKLR